MGKTIDNIAKWICAIVAIFAILSLIGLLFGGTTDTYNEDARFMEICDDKGIILLPTTTQTPIPIATATPTQIESSVVDFINIHKSGQDITVECKHLSVSGNNNAIQIANSDVELITILGYGNSVGYSCYADPRIRDIGDYNDVWQRWLT